MSNNYRAPRPPRYWTQGDFHVLYLLAQGRVPIEIAQARRTSYTAVKMQIHALRTRVGVSTTSELIALFKSSGRS